MSRCRTSLASVSLLLALLCSAPHLYAQASAPQLDAVLAQMDAASKTFKSASADFQGELVQKIGNMTDTTNQKGSMYIERANGSTSFGAAVYEFAPGGPPSAKPSKVVDYAGGTLRVYSPGDGQVDLFKSGNNQSIEGYFALGFGGSRRDLEAAWQITDKGPATLTEDGHPVKCEVLALVSKDPNVRNQFRQVTLWLDPARDVSLKQVFETPSGVQRTANYSNIRLDKGKRNKFAFDIPTKGVTVVPH